MRYILALIVIFAAHGAYANCGPTLELGPEIEFGQDNYGWDQDISFEIKLDIPIGKSKDVECDKIKADTAKRAADAMQERIDNLDRIVRICEKQWIESLCSRLEELGAEIGTQ